MKKYTFKSDKKRQYHREGRISKAEVMMIMILFHSSGYRCLKHFYLDRVCKHMRHLFPDVVSYNRFVELRKYQSPLLPTLSFTFPLTDESVFDEKKSIITSTISALVSR